ncbi:PilT/PilU family type 4a pilus ATPase [Myxococcota bacterium]|nr:PilT/PilU family type 4a pilus ATPase [Myxococcota bacterium]
MSPTLPELLAEARRAGASDLHLVSGRAPLVRVDGRIEPLPRPALARDELEGLLRAALSEGQWQRFQRERELCVSLELPELGFFRVNLASELGRTDASVRLGRQQVPRFDELGLPETLLEQVRRPAGLVLVTGPTGVGKTTTLNAVVGRVLAEERKKIVMIEDPIEFVHPPGRGLVVQREVGLDTAGFGPAVIHALRQDPDVIVIGEMRDLETISTALTAAETGHLVLATLHTSGATGTIHRILDVFPPAQQAQVRTQLAATLQAVLTQRLLPRAVGKGRVLAYELMVATDAIRNLVREQKVHQIPSAIQTGRSLGMRLMDHMIRDLYDAGEITWDTALSAVGDRRVLERG